MHAAATRVFRPSTRAYRSYLLGTLTAFGVFIALGILRIAAGTDKTAALAELGGLVAVAVGSAGYAVAYLRRAAVVVEPDGLTLVGALRRRHVPSGEVAVAVYVAALESPAMRQTSARLYLMRRDGRRLAALAEGFWQVDTLRHIADALDVRVDRFGRVSPAVVRAKYRHAVSWPVARPVLFSLLATGAIVIGVVAAAAIAAVLTTY